MKKLMVIMLAVLISIASLPAYAFADDVIETENVSDVYINEENNVAPYFNPVTSTQSGTWIKESNGRWWYKHADGSYTKYDWEYINGSWYFFDANGWMWTEWLSWEGNWYYLNPSGVMHTGWLLDGGKWYYFTSRGIMVYRWNKINGFWYYFDGSDGSMNKESFSYAGRTYTFYQSGAHEGALKSTKIDIDRVEQANSNWCWAACAVMVGPYCIDYSISQSAVVKKTLGNYNNQSVDADLEEKADEYASDKKKNFKQEYNVDGRIVFNDMRDLIDDNHPFVVRIIWINENERPIGGHSMVCIGYDQHFGSLELIDPSDRDNSGTYDYKELMSKFKRDGRTGYCSMILYY